jgi:hypothetical protein
MPAHNRSTPQASPEELLVEKLRRIEALYARAGTDGERLAAHLAKQRIKARLQDLAAQQPEIEYRFSMSDQWSRHLFVALMRRYDIVPYRYHGQRRTTVMARVTKQFVDETLWPEFQDLRQTLTDYFDQVTDRVIEQALDIRASEAEERQEHQALPPMGSQAPLS